MNDLAQKALEALPPLEGDPYLPLYRRLFQTIAGRIARGDWKPGDSLPAESLMARQYNVAPGTVRKAIDELVDRNLVDRRHGLGTFVARPNFDNAMLRFFRFRTDEGERLIPASRINITGVVPVPPALTSLWSIPQTDVIHLNRHRSWEGAVRLVEDIYLPVDRFRALLEVDANAIGPLLYPAYERLCGQVVFAIDEDIAVTEASSADAATLGLKPDDLVVNIRRVARNAMGEAIEWRISRAEARRFRYHLTIGADATGGPAR